MLEQPARLIARKDVGHIADRRQRLMHLRDQRLLWIFKNRFAAEQRQRNCQFRRNMRGKRFFSNSSHNALLSQIFITLYNSSTYLSLPCERQEIRRTSCRERVGHEV